MYFASSKEIEKLDSLAVESGLEIKQMMELASWHMLGIFKELSIEKNKSIVIVCGRGNKGGDGLSAARHLINHGYSVSVILLSKNIKPDPQHHLDLLQKMKSKVLFYDYDKDESKTLIEEADIIIDALLGYSLEGNPRASYGEIIKLINNVNKLVISYDIPSGVDASTGACLEPCINAKATLSLAMFKKVFDTKDGLAKSGQVYLADIGIPDFLYDQIAKNSRPDFDRQGFIKL